MKTITSRGIVAITLLLWGSLSAQAQTITNFYVSLTGGIIYPYTNWAMAAHDIQPAVNLAQAPSTVWVSNGVYTTGSNVASASTLSNRVVITKNITLKSLNGPSKTIIQGGGAYNNKPIRCVYMSAGTLDGFTLSNGMTYSGRFAGQWRGRGSLCDCFFDNNQLRHYGVPGI